MSQDASGRRRPDLKFRDLNMTWMWNTVIMSLGTSPNPTYLFYNKGLKSIRECIIAFEERSELRHLKDGICTGDDAVTVQSYCILAMGGKAGAKGIDEYLKINNVNEHLTDFVSGMITSVDNHESLGFTEFIFRRRGSQCWKLPYSSSDIS